MKYFLKTTENRYLLLANSGFFKICVDISEIYVKIITKMLQILRSF